MAPGARDRGDRGARDRLGEALGHPAVERAQAIVGAPSYEDSLASLEARKDAPVAEDHRSHKAPGPEPAPPAERSQEAATRPEAGAGDTVVRPEAGDGDTVVRPEPGTGDTTVRPAPSAVTAMRPADAGDTTVRPVPSADAAVPARPAAAAQPAEPAQPPAAAQPAEPAQPTAAAQPAEPAQPTAATQPAEPAQPTAPATRVGPTPQADSGSQPTAASRPQDARAQEEHDVIRVSRRLAQPEPQEAWPDSEQETRPRPVSAAANSAAREAAAPTRPPQRETAAPTQPPQRETAAPTQPPQRAAAPGSVAAGDEPEDVRVSAIHLGGVTSLRPGEADIELRLSQHGLDIVRDGGGGVIGRLGWNEIQGLEVPPPRGLLRRRRAPRSHLVVRAEQGDASFEIPAVYPEELREHLEPLLARHGWRSERR